MYRPIMRCLCTLLSFWAFSPIATLYAKDPARITAQELKVITEKGKPITLIDVRTPGEYNKGHIQGAINIPLKEIPTLKEFPYQGKVVLYCTTGVRSSKAKRILEGKGIRRVVDLEGGIKAWKKVGGKVVTTLGASSKTADEELPIMSGYPRSFQVPKGVCEQGIEPSLTFGR
ncbi:MAG: rhodanese-like domain-containing protein [Deltaproteobacteria bacterium]|nr:rhodanese-like domain-containing protein [Deltaproteobacteria bacterium]